MIDVSPDKCWSNNIVTLTGKYIVFRFLWDIEQKNLF
ncbi:MAG: hypothetical protein ACI85E_001718, partial [Marinomonas primoryensis]